MDSLDNSKDRQSRSIDELYDRLEQLIEQLPKDRQKVAMGMLHAGTLAEDLKKAIADSGLTHYAIAKAAGVNVGGIDRFMRGERDMRIETASKICEVLGYGLAKLDRSGSEPDSSEAMSSKPAKKTAKKSPKKKPSK